MNRPMKRYVEKFEAIDYAAGIYSARSLKRERYNQHDFLEYLDAYDLVTEEESAFQAALYLEPIALEDVGE